MHNVDLLWCEEDGLPDAVGDAALEREARPLLTVPVLLLFVVVLRNRGQFLATSFEN
jgi:hypothetical protein